MDESSQTNARVSAELHILRRIAEYNDKQGSPAAAAEGSATESSTNNSNEIIEVTEDSFENDAPPELDDSDDDSAVEIVDAAAFREQQQQAAAAAAATTKNNSNGGEDSDEELQCVGTANETKLPHNRQDCLTFRYNNNNSSSTSNGTSCCAETTLENAKFCQLCYCYVCDKPASECTSWYLGERGAVHEDGNGGPPEDTKQSSSKTDDTEEDTSLQQYNNHCNATDKGSAKNLWKNMRTAIKNGRDPSVVTANAAASNPDESLAQYLARYTVPGSAVSTAESAAAALAEQLRQRQRERHRYRAHATGRGGAHQRRTAARDGGEENYSSIYGSVSMDAANAMDFSSTTTTTSSRRSRAPRQERRTRPAGSDNEQRSRHSNHRDRMRTQAILEDLYS
mmetsp:Transcript_24847/g.38096  ORF Transcript_24847/g.38096 Transcript_24847/m.38096 type:complete len:396 (+) Transcript_24847:127-1314(+)